VGICFLSSFDFKKVMGKRYFKDITRLGNSFFDVKAWYEGESEELKRVLSLGFFNTIFLVENDSICVYYEEEEIENFYKVLDGLLTEDFFNNLCDDFFELIKRAEKVSSSEEIFKIMIESWPALTIFHEISNYPEYANEDMLRRLERVRKTTEDFSYNLSNRLNLSQDTPGHYIFFGGEIINKPFGTFLKENDFEVVNET